MASLNPSQFAGIDWTEVDEYLDTVAAKNPKKEAPAPSKSEAVKPPKAMGSKVKPSKGKPKGY